MTTSGRAAGVAPRTRLGATGVSLDAGPLVSPYARDDARHVAVVTWMKRFQGESHTVEPMLAQAAYFLPLCGRAVIADLAASGRLLLHHPDASAYSRMSALRHTSADQDPDWADIAPSGSPKPPASPASSRST